MNNDIELIQTDDFFARYLFANAGNEDILLHFINAIRKDANENVFESIELLDTFNIKENIFERETIVDVKAHTLSGEMVVVEVQSAGNIKYVPRILAYIAINYLKPLNIDLETIKEKKRNKLDYNLRTPVISINILNFIIMPNNPKTHTVYRLKEIETSEELTKDWEMHLVELPKLLNMTSKELILWVKFFTSRDLEGDKMIITKEDAIFEKVFDCYDRFKGDEKLMEVYRKGKIDMLTQIDMLNQERLEGREESKIEIARSMLQDNLSVELIAKHTGLTAVEIEEIKSEM